jgi:hypothetical protein
VSPLETTPVYTARRSYSGLAMTEEAQHQVNGGPRPTDASTLASIHSDLLSPIVLSEHDLIPVHDDADTSDKQVLVST